MNQAVKNIIKYLIVFAIIGTVVYFGIKLIFPEPNPLQAYNNNIELTEIETYGEMLEGTDQLVVLSESNLANPSFNLENYNKLLYSKLIITSLNDVNSFIIDDLAFTKNTVIYNTNVKTTSKLLSEIKETYLLVNTYLVNNLNPFLQQNNSSVSSLNLYINAMLPFYAELCEDYQAYTSANIQIVKQIDATIRNNSWSQTVLDIVDKWTINLITKLKNSETVFTSQFNNANACFNFVTVNSSEEKFVSYYTDHENLNTKISEINSVNIAELTNFVLTESELTYVDGIEDATLKTKTTSVLAFLKGEN